MISNETYGTVLDLNLPPKGPTPALPPRGPQRGQTLIDRSLIETFSTSTILLDFFRSVLVKQKLSGWSYRAMQENNVFKFD